MSLSMPASPDVDAMRADAAGEAMPVPTHRRFWLLAAAPVALGLIWPGRRSPLADMAVELVMIVLLVLAVVRTPVFKDWCQGVPRSARRRAKFVVVALIAAQFFSISANAFPLTSWTMYTSPTVDVAVAYRIVGYTAAGDEVDFVPSMTNRTMSTKMPTAHIRLYSERMLDARLDPADAERVEQVTQELERVIDLLAKLYNEESPDAAVGEVVVFRTTFTSEQRRAGEGQTEAVWRQDVGMP